MYRSSNYIQSCGPITRRTSKNFVLCKMADGVDIDLYADDLEQEFNQDGDYNHDANVDLYDDVITAPSSDGQQAEEVSSSGSSSGLPPMPTKRVAVYVGNLTWWTTDQDVIDAINSVNVTDVLDIKFYENRANGQSKGFCVVTLGSDNSFRLVMEKLPKKELHGQNPVVTPCSRQNLNHFEMQSRKPSQGGSGRSGGMGQRGMSSQGMGRNRNSQPPFQSQQRMPGLPMGPPPPQGPPPQYQGGNSKAPPPPQMQGPPPPHPGPPPPGTPSGHLPPPGIQGPPPPRPGGPPPGSMRMPPPRGPPPVVGPRGPPPDPRGPPPIQHDWDHRPPVSHPPPQPPVGPPLSQGGAPPGRPPPIVSGPGMPPSMPPPTSHVNPAPHVNPAFFTPHSHQGVPQGPPPTSQPGDMYNRPPGSQYPDYRSLPPDRHEPPAPSISEAEFEEIMNRNRTVSSSAIARAVADASAGDFASAIETLVTAISLIKQSKVANDDRCKILISSLQDTLHGIESKSYGSRSKDRPRSRERERSRERSSRREKSSRRDRSRSRDRDYRERSRERDRYHDDRYREKDRDRDRDREHRSSRH
ncbi:cleavage and polyadenylation specificity factor subunit 6-like isoform X3 [Centruroides vittatus]|uniref:cleavage and polyadenylation specificity factor subunit 6-like isoform X3 n=2 Tax=Centruroides TaxID=6875 RepID=UPI00350F4FF9